MKQFNEDELLMLSGIQHYAFCKRQWALIHIEKQWMDNVRTMEGHFLHEKVDDPYIVETRGTLIIARAVPIVSYMLGLYGVADMVEYVQDDSSDNSVVIEGHKGYWKPYPVEYKRGKPKPDDSDALQLCAQGMCLEEMHGVKIDFGYIFYGQVRRREEIIFDDAIRNRVMELSAQMHETFKEGRTPIATPGISCKQCSLVDICMPKLTRKNKSATKYINKIIAEIEAEG